MRGLYWANTEKEYDTPAYRAFGITIAPREYMPEHLIGLRGPKGMILLNTNTGKVSFFDWPPEYTIPIVTFSAEPPTPANEGTTQ